jgi:hypothetical protein
LVVLLSVLLHTTVTVQAADGVLLLVNGNVTVKSHGAVYPARTAQRLQSGDSVDSLGGSVTVFLSDGTFRRVEKQSSFTLLDTTEKTSRDTLARRLMNTMRETTVRGKGPVIEPEPENEKEMILIHPYNSVISIDELWFEWEPSEGLKGVEVVLKSPSPVYQYSFMAKPGESRTFLPDEAPPLLSGVKYYWRMKGFETRESPSHTSKVCWFSIHRAEAIDRLNNDLKELDRIDGLDQDDRDFLRANLFVSHGLHHRAVGIFRNFMSKFPGDEGLKEMLAGVFIKIKNYHEAQKLKISSRDF